MPLAIYALALAAFAIGSAEFVVSGILPPLAADLDVTIPTAGLIVTGYAIGVAIGGPILTVLTARLAPKTVLIGTMILFALSQVLCAMAPSYTLLLVARLFSACAHGVFFGAGSLMVAGLVPKERRGSAFSLFVGGITIANLLGLPGGTAIGLAFGWRMTFIAVGLFGALAVFALVWRLPAVSAEARRHSSFVSQLKALRHQQVFLSYITITLVMVGTVAFGAYQVPLMLSITHLSPEVLPLYLLLGGVGSMLGIWLGGAATDRRPMPALLAILLLQSALSFTMLFAMHDKVWMAVNIFGSGIFGFAFSTPLQARIIHGAREAPNFAASLTSTAFNIGIAAGAFIGAMLLNAGVSYADLPTVGIVTSLLAAGTAGLSWWLEHHQAIAA